MDLKEAIESRRSVRRFQAKPVPKKVIESLIDAAIMAPSTMNIQPWLFTVATGKSRDEIVGALGLAVNIIEDILSPFRLEAGRKEEVKEKALRFYSNLGGAPVVIVASIPREDSSFLRRMYLESAAMAIENLMLAAHAEGLGTCSIIVHSWVARDVEKILKIEDREIALFIALGYPAESPETPPRKRNVAQWLGFES